MSKRIKLQVRHSRLGCLTCKIRRVKCDETQPECLKCTNTGRKCEGPSTDRFSFKRYKPKSPPTSDIASSAITRPLSPPFASAAEVRAFDFYLHQAGPSIAGPLDGAFWAKLLPQLCHHDLTIRRAVLAMSVFYEQPFRDANGTLSSDQVLGMRWYKQSVEAALTASIAHTDATQLEHSLLTCMLFIVIEMQHANSPGAMQLLGHGYSLIALYLKKRAREKSVSPWMSHLLPMFARQASQVGFRLSLPTDFDAITEHLLPTPSESISTFAEARDAFHFLGNRSLALHRSITALGRTDGEIPETLRQEQEEISQSIDTWEHQMHNLARRIPMSPAMRRLYHALLCYKKSTVLWLSKLFIQSTDPYSQDTSKFSEILDHAEASLDALPHQPSKGHNPPSVQEMGVIPGVCFVGWKCQDEPTRQRAAALLKRAALQENINIARQQTDTIAGILKGDPRIYDRSAQNGFEEDIFASLPA